MSLFGKNIKKIRNTKGLTQSQLAEMIGVTRGALSSYEEERAEPKIDTVISTSKKFSISTDDLLTSLLTVNKLSNFNNLTISENSDSKKNIVLSCVQKDFIKESIDKTLIVNANHISSSFLSQEVLLFLKKEKIKEDCYFYIKTKKGLWADIITVKNDYIKINNTKIKKSEILDSYKIIGYYLNLNSPLLIQDQLNLLNERIDNLEKQLIK